MAIFKRSKNDIWICDDRKKKKQRVDIDIYTSKGLEWNFKNEEKQVDVMPPSTGIRSPIPEQKGNSKNKFEKGTTSKSGIDKTIHENTPGKQNLMESLLNSYQSIQQTLLLHIMHATKTDAPDDKLESLKNSFKKMNDQANLLIN
uniref:Uncharacterized protein n=1 Tax=Daucus carota subsp. sativus TaxID=79200 RepID=A0A175YLY5_DAUCS